MKIAIKRYGNNSNIPVWAIFMMSSLGKLAATLVTYPILTMKVKLQADKSKDDQEQPQEQVGMLSKILEHYNDMGGFLGLYKGLEAKLI